jgi:hypothetical protein
MISSEEISVSHHHRALSIVRSSTLNPQLRGLENIFWPRLKHISSKQSFPETITMKAFTAIFAVAAMLGTALATPINVNVGDTAVERRDVEVDNAPRQLIPPLPIPTARYVPVLPTLPTLPTLPPLPTLGPLPTLPSLTLPTLSPIPGLPTLPPIPTPTTPTDLLTALRVVLTQIINILTAISKLLYSLKPKSSNTHTKIYQGIPFLTAVVFHLCPLCPLCRLFLRSLASQIRFPSSRLRSLVSPRPPTPFSVSWHSSNPGSDPSRQYSATRPLD